MKLIIAMLILITSSVAWGHDYTSVMDSLKPFNGPTIALNDFTLQIPKMEDPEKNVLKYKGDDTYEGVDMPGQGNISSSNYAISLTTPKYQEVTFTDLSVYKKICFAILGDSKRCVDTKWLYLLMVAADIKEEK